MIKKKNNCLKVECKKVEIEKAASGKKKNINKDAKEIKEKNNNIKDVKEVKEKNNKKDVKEEKEKLVKQNVKSKITKPEQVKVVDGTKIFAIYEKRKMIAPLRQQLIKRGWTEKTIENALQLPKFIWLSRSNDVNIEGSPIVNRLKQETSKNFCYKDILVNYGRTIKCKPDSATSKLNLPRTFKLFENEKDDFLEDYRLTAYSSFIRLLCSSGSKAFSPTGKINAKWIDYAIENMETAILNTNSSVEKQQMNHSDFSKFKQIYQSVVKFDSKVKANKNQIQELLQKCKEVYGKCKECKEIWPQFEKDGIYNLWLLKPARRSLGIGIKLFDDDIDIFCYAKDNEGMKYLVQKYIERPMLIYNTKFDLRQYFLIVHHVNKVCLWMYKMSYLKFSTKLYDPLNYKVSVHITNTAIQSKYSIDKNRDANIPQCNEWSSDKFLEYLKSQNKLHLWKKEIYPAMKRNIITTVSAALDLSKIQPNHFHLYGCDFIINEDYEPVLLEINGCPILTSVIDSMCLEDLVKVIIDLKETPSADTGHFEMIWEKKL